MTKATFTVDKDKLEVRLERIFEATPERLWQAYTDPVQVTEWWERTTVDELDVRVGGRWRFASGDNGEYGFRGEYTEVDKPHKMVRTFEYEPYRGHISVESVTFEPLDGGRTKLIAVQTFTNLDDLNGMVGSGMERGAVAGLKRLAEVVEVQNKVTKRSITHGSFTVERMFTAPSAKVFAAFAEQDAKERWFKGPETATSEHAMDFSIGGRETNTGMFHDGIMHRFEATYYDIVPNERIVYAYEMYLNDVRISVSLATITFEDADGKTQLTLHEDGAFLDGFDKPTVREAGTRSLLDALAASLT
jgi:uncharacterized protein YndB with AHSA1/START domain